MTGKDWATLARDGAGSFTELRKKPTKPWQKRMMKEYTAKTIAEEAAQLTQRLKDAQETTPAKRPRT